jgi:hypothetical protein
MTISWGQPRPKKGLLHYLSELHDEVHEALDAIVVRQRRGTFDKVRNGHVATKLIIHELLTRREVAVHIDLDLKKVRVQKPSAGSQEVEKGSIERAEPSRPVRSGHFS